MELWVGAALGTVGLFWWGMRRYLALMEGDTPRDQVRKRLRTSPRARAGDVHPGHECAVIGKVTELEPIVSPVSGVECASWELRIRRAYVDRRGSWGWVQLAATSQVAPMFVEDESGRVRVDSSFAVPVLDNPVTTSCKGTVPPPVAEILRRHRRPTSGTFELDEAVMPPGEQVVVVGVAAVEPDPSGVTTDYRTAPVRTVLEAKRRRPVCISNAPDLIGKPVR